MKLHSFLALVLTSAVALLACSNQEAELAQAATSLTQGETEKAKLEAEMEKVKAQAAIAQAQAEAAKAKEQADLNNQALLEASEGNQGPAERQGSPKGKVSALDQLAAGVGATADETPHECPPGDPMCAPGMSKVTPTAMITVQERKSDGNAWDASPRGAEAAKARGCGLEATWTHS